MASLDTLRDGHPRLLVSSLSALTSAFQPSGCDHIRARLLAHLVRLAEASLREPPIFFGRDLNFHHSSRRALGVIMHTTAAFFITGEPRFLGRAAAELEAACLLPHWHPETFLDTAELALAVALGYDWLHHVLTPAQRGAARDALLRNALALAPSIYEGAARPEGAEKVFSTHSVGWVNQVHNWNQVCNTGLLCAALAVAGEDGVPQGLPALVVKGAISSLPRAMRSSFMPDGAFPESPQYWGFGTSFNVIALAALASATGGEGGLVEACPGLARTAAYRLHVESPLGLSLTYGDNGQEELNADPHLGWLATRFGQPSAAAHARALLHAALEKLERKAAAAGGVSKPKNKFDRLWALHALWLPGAEGAPTGGGGGGGGGGAEVSLDARFRGIAELAFFRSAWGNPRAAWVGVKGGSNGHNHGHMDLGSFQFDAQGQRWVTDFGSDDYNLPKYNSRLPGSPRWRYLRPGNRGHSTLTAAAGGLSRVAAALQGLRARAPVVAFHSTPAGGHAVLDGCAVYDGVAWARGVALLPGRARVLVQDEVRAAAGGGGSAAAPRVGAVWRLYTGAQVSVEVGGRVALLRSGGEVLRATLLEPPGAAWAVGGAAPGDVPGPPGDGDGDCGGEGDGDAGGTGTEEEGGEGGAAEGVFGELTEKQRAKKEARRAARREAKGYPPQASTHVDVKDVRRGVLRSTVREDPNEGVSLLSVSAEFEGAAGGRVAVLLEPEEAGATGALPPALRPLAEWEGRVEAFMYE
jgi:hypothetical protein